MTGFTDSPQGGTSVLENVEEELAYDHPWQVIVWNDPVNLMNYVTGIFIEVLKVTKDKAEVLMQTVHVEGKAIVADGTQDHCQELVATLGAYGLWSTMSKTGGNS
jgi:ATP-dependent Clp protease adaptor protein ClpS